MDNRCHYCSCRGRVPTFDWRDERSSCVCPKCDGSGKIGGGIEVPAGTLEDAFERLRRLQRSKP